MKSIIDVGSIRTTGLSAFLLLLFAITMHLTAKSQGRYGAMAYEKEIRKAALRNGIDPYLVLAVVEAESAGDPYAVSHKNARGLGQLMLATARSLRPEEFISYLDLHEVETNLDLSAQHLRELAEKVESMFPKAPLRKKVILVAAAYNSGILDDAGRIPRIRETRIYSARVWQYYKAFRRVQKF